MEDRVQFIHDVAKCLAKFYGEPDDLSDIMSGAILGVIMADNIVSGEFDTKGEDADNIALTIIASVTLAEALPEKAFTIIDKMSS